MRNNRIASVIAAAGDGRRIGGGNGGDIVKTYRKLGGLPLLLHAVRGLADYGCVQPVIRERDHALYQQIIASAAAAPPAAGNGSDIRPPVFGGATRAASVLAGLNALRDVAPDIVLIHDAARPFIPSGLIDRLIEALDQCAGAAPALPIMDALKKQNQEKLLTIDKTNVFRAQTPQAFHYPIILRAYQQCEQNGNMDAPDDLAVLERSDEKVQLIAGDVRNIKITEERDFDDFRHFHHFARVGLGVDAHRFGAGDHIWLGGHRIAHDQGIAAHSDGDIVLHALADAIFGAAGDGDLGQHFPSSDPQWLNARSQVFVERAMASLQKKGLIIINADIMIICTRPAIAPHRQAIRQKIADMLKIGIEQVSVKATTTDGMGLTGKNEGIAAQAIVSTGARQK